MEAAGSGARGCGLALSGPVSPCRAAQSHQTFPEERRRRRRRAWGAGEGGGGDDAFMLVVFEVGLTRREQRDVAGEASVQQADRRDERPPAVPRCQGVARQALRYAQTHTLYVAPAGATPGRGSAQLPRGCYGHSVKTARLWHGVHINQGGSRGVPCLLVERAERRVVERACASKGKRGRH